jgi:hypothetical protein
MHEDRRGGLTWLRDRALGDKTETWAQRVAEWRASGQTAGEFAAGRGFAASTLRWWSSRLGRQTPGWVRVVASKVAPRGAGSVELEVGAVRVHVRAGFDRALLAEVLEGRRH